MNTRLLWLGLVGTDRCSCGLMEDWRYMVCDSLYEDGSDLAGLGMGGVDGAIRFDGALDKPGVFLAFKAYLWGVFDARRLQVQAEGGEIH